MAAAVALAACSGEANPQPTPKPTGFNFSTKDLYREVPADICRNKDSAFLEKLIGRVDRALPIESRNSATFQDFQVVPGFDGKGQDAVLRVKVRLQGKEGVMVYAYGPFDPTNCSIRGMKAGVGPYPDPTAPHDEFAVPDVA